MKLSELPSLRKQETKPPVRKGEVLIGALIGEGVGGEVMPVALGLLETLARKEGVKVTVRTGGAIGHQAKRACGSSLSEETVAFTHEIFSAGGALFCGPGGDRFVYELRKAFGLFCKLTPIRPFPELADTGPLRPAVTAGVDILAVREGLGGLYQGEWTEGKDAEGLRWASHGLRYTETMVRDILTVAIAAATRRRKLIHLVVKPGGAPSISGLWSDCARAMTTAAGVRCVELEIDNAAYQMTANPGQFDVIVSPNMFGDVLADCGAAALGSRGLSFSGNFNHEGHGVYQTGHGAAHDIAGKGVVNPIGQILSLGMMLRESFGWPEADDALRGAIRDVLREGLSTADIPLPGGKVVTTEAFGRAVQRRLEA